MHHDNGTRPKRPLMTNVSAHLDAETEFHPRLFHVGGEVSGRWASASLKVTTGHGGDLTLMSPDPQVMRRLSHAAMRCAQLLDLEAGVAAGTDAEVSS